MYERDPDACHIGSDSPDSPPDHRSAAANFEADKAALQALVQAAVNVELFTVPLYMCTMKSIQGTHAINANGISYYKGRRWPGMATGTLPVGAPPEKTAPQRAYNVLFSVFIDEMLHLQMAANLCGAVGVTPTFNSRP